MEQDIEHIDHLHLLKKIYGKYGIVSFVSGIFVLTGGSFLSRLNINPIIIIGFAVIFYSVLNLVLYEYILSKQKRTLKKISYYIEQISEGITSTDFNLSGFEDSDNINKSLQKISDNINNISTEIETVNHNILDGNVDLRVSEDNRRGCFYDICFNTNNLISSFHWILDSLTVPIVIINKKSTITYLNNQAAQFVKKNKARLINKAFYTYFDLDDTSCDGNIIKGCFATGEITNTKSKIYIENEARNVYYSVIPIKDDNHDITSALICFIDYLSISGDEFAKKPEDIYFEKRMLRLINAVEEYSRYESAAKSSYLNF